MSEIFPSSNLRSAPRSLPMLAVVQMMLALVPLYSPSISASSLSPPRCCVRQQEDSFFDELLEEAQLEQAAKIVELPVMFVDTTTESSTMVDFDRWQTHRSPDRYYRLLVGILFSVTTRRIAAPLLILMAFASAVCTYDHFSFADPLLPTLQLPLTPFELTGPALGLLLVFRSDNAYARFKEGKLLAWEISTAFRSAMRRLMAWTSPPHVSDIEREAAEDLILGCCLLHRWIMDEHLRQREGGGPPARHRDLLVAALGEGAEQDLDGLPPPTPYIGIELLSLGASQRLPSLTDQELIAIDESLATVTEDLGKCEALLSTPIPLGFTRYTLRFLWAWLYLLPFALTREFHSVDAYGNWWEIDVVGGVTFIGSIFLSIEDIAVQIEEPFAILPLEFHHRWLLRDAKQSRQLMQRSSARLSAAGGQRRSRRTQRDGRGRA